MSKKKVEEENKTKNDKKVLSDLVLSSDVKYTTIILELCRVNLIEQYEEELKLRGKVELEPTITEEEFNKIINGR